MFSGSRNTALRQINAQLRYLRLSYSYQTPSHARFLSSLAILEQRDGKLQASSLASIAAAQKLGGSVTAFVAGSGAKSAAEEAAKVKGVEKIIYVENSAYERVRELHLLFAIAFCCSYTGIVSRVTFYVN
jgi:electron transfer flavoprotein alpha subunit